MEALGNGLLLLRNTETILEIHWRRSPSLNRSRKPSHKLDGIRVGRIRTVPFSSDSAYVSDAYDPVKIRFSESQAEA